MTIASSNQLHSIDETCLSDLSAENESTISGGTFLDHGRFLSSLFGGLPSYGSSQPSAGASTKTSVSVYTSIANTNTNTNSSSSSSSSNSNSSGAQSGGHGGGYGWYG